MYSCFHFCRFNCRIDCGVLSSTPLSANLSAHSRTRQLQQQKADNSHKAAAAANFIPKLDFSTPARPYNSLYKESGIWTPITSPANASK